MNNTSALFNFFRFNVQIPHKSEKWCVTSPTVSDRPLRTYYIDMEYCWETLNDQILGLVRSDPRANPEAGGSGGDDSGSAEPDNTEVFQPTEDLEALNFDLDQDSVTDRDLDGYIEIMEDIVAALI